MWQRLSLRARLFTIEVLGVAVSLALGGLALYAAVGVAGFRTLDASSRASAAEIAGLLAEGRRLPEPIPVTGSQVVQVLDARHRVVTASPNSDRLTALLTRGQLAEAMAGGHPEVPGSRVGLASPLRVTAVRAGPPGDRVAVVVAQPVGEVQHSQRVLGLTLLLTFPLLLVVLAVIAWRVTGAALRPVDSLRASAERISGTGGDDQLPVPAAQDEIRSLAETLNAMLARLADARLRQRSFVADAAHELRSPLASMRTQLEVSERLHGSDALAGDLRLEVERMTDLVDDLLTLARLDGAPATAVAPDPVPLAPMLTGLVSSYSDSRALVRLDEVDPCVVLARPEDVRRIVANLLDNAVRHADSSVRLSACLSDGHVRMSVTDDGPGIPETDRDRVFERFTRLDSSRDRDTGGNGLGLAIVHGLVTRAGGTVRLTDAPGGGLVAEVILPARDDGTATVPSRN